MGRKKVSSGLFYPGGRVLHITCQVCDRDGNFLLTEEKIREALEKHSGAFTSYAYILHDKDVYDGEAIEMRNERRGKMFIDTYATFAGQRGLEPCEGEASGFVHDTATEADAWAEVDRICPARAVGELKDPHYHVILQFEQSRKVDQIARWFGINPNFVDVKTGRHALVNQWNYLVHLKNQDKYQYAPEAVKASFDYVHDLDERIVKDAMHEKYHMDVDDINDIICKVAREGMTMSQVKELVTEAVFVRNERLFRSARQDYILHNLRMPGIREVYYVEAAGADETIGQGGMGKTVCTHALAKQIAKDYGADITKRYDELIDYIYDSGDSSVALQKYDAQPILVLNEMSAYDMMQAFGGRKGVKELLDPFPTKQAQNIKFGSTVVVAKYIIINGIQSFNAFKEGLAGTYVDKQGNRHEAETKAMRQFDRRFWANIRIVNEEYMDIMFNRGLFNDTQEYDQYITLRRIRVNFGNLARKLNGHAQAEVEGRVLKPLTDKIKEYEQSHNENSKISNIEDIPDEFADYGNYETEEEMRDGFLPFPEGEDPPFKFD